MHLKCAIWCILTKYTPMKLPPWSRHQRFLSHPQTSYSPCNSFLPPHSFFLVPNWFAFLGTDQFSFSRVLYTWIHIVYTPVSGVLPHSFFFQFFFSFSFLPHSWCLLFSGGVKVNASGTNIHPDIPETLTELLKNGHELLKILFA